MIELAANHCGPDDLTRHILRRTPRRRRSVAAESLVSASLDLLVFGRRACGARYPDWVRCGPHVWRIGDHILRYHHRLTDRDIMVYTRLNRKLTYTAVVPDNCKVLFASALSSALNRPPAVRTIEDFVSMRIVLSSMDLAVCQWWSIAQTIRKLIDLYNDRTLEIPSGVEIRIALSE